MHDSQSIDLGTPAERAAALEAAFPNGFAAVIFDMDGTLLDTERLHQSAMRAAAASLDLDIEAGVLTATIGVHRDRSRQILVDRLGDAFPLDAFYDATDRHFHGSAEAGIPHHIGVSDLLDHLRQRGIPIAVATSTASPMAQQYLATAGLIDRFDTIVTRSDVEHPKPAPDPYLLAAKRLGIDPALCLAVEDSPNGVRSAAAAGMATVMVPDLLPPDAEMERLTVAIFPDLAEVLGVIETMILPKIASAR